MSISSDPLLCNRCKILSRTLWFGTALLYEDRICIRGWTLRGRYRRVLSLERVEHVQWRAVLDDVNLILRLHDGTVVPLQLLKGAGTWNVTLHRLLDKSLLAHHGLPSVDEEATR